MNSEIFQPKFWKKALSLVLAVIIGFGTFVSLTASESLFQNKLNVFNMLSVYAAELLYPDSVHPEYYEENHMVGLYNQAGDAQEEIQYKIDNDEWQTYEKPFALPIGKTVQVYARIGEDGVPVVKTYTSKAEDYLNTYKEQNADLSISNNDANFDIARTYDSKTKAWFFSTQSSVTAGKNMYIAKLPDGSSLTFVKNADGDFENQPTGYGLTVKEDAYIVQTDDLLYTYSVSSGRLVSIADRNGHSIDFAYENDNLTSVSFTEDETKCNYAVEEENGIGQGTVLCPAKNAHGMIPCVEQN